MSDGRSRAWTFTSYELDPPVFDAAHKYKYLCYQREKCPETSREHWQGYCVFTDAITLRSIKRRLGDTLHYERARGNAQQNKDYCSKSASKVGPFSEFGDIPSSGTRTDISSFRDAIGAGASDRDLCDQYPILVAKYPRFIGFARDAYIADVPRHDLVVAAFIGPPGTGKTTAAGFLFPGAYWKPPDRWWFGYAGQSVIIWDELRHGQSNISEFLRVAQPNPISVETKGGHVRLRNRVLLITSNQQPYDWFPSANPVDNAAVSRRCPEDHILQFQRWPSVREAAERSAEFLRGLGVPADLISAVPTEGALDFGARDTLMQ